jgi:hypothetical protein
MLTAEKRARVITALIDNSNAIRVAKKVGDVDPSTVRRIAKSAGIELSDGKTTKGHHRVSVEKRAQIIAALRDSPNASQVAKQIGGVSRMTVWKIAKAANIRLGTHRVAHRGSPTVA